MNYITFHYLQYFDQKPTDYRLHVNRCHITALKFPNTVLYKSSAR